MNKRTVCVRHWLPIITFCPVNSLPDFIYVSITFEGNTFVELYGIRRKIRKSIQWKKIFMEDAAAILLSEIHGSSTVEVALMFGRHIVRLKNSLIAPIKKDEGAQ